MCARTSAIIGLLAIMCFQPSMIARADEPELKIWFDRPAAKWTDALPIGNGRLGAMVFGDPAKDRLQLNEESL